MSNSNTTDTTTSLAEFSLNNALTHPDFKSMFDDVQKLNAIKFYAQNISKIITTNQSEDVRKAKDSLKNKRKAISTALSSIFRNLKTGEYTKDKENEIWELLKAIKLLLQPLYPDLKTVRAFGLSIVLMLTLLSLNLLHFLQ